MAVKLYRPTTPARRGMTSRDNSEITKTATEKSLLKTKVTGSGRNNRGTITVRRRGGGAKRFYRIVDFKGQPETEVKVLGVEYDPNRSAHIALVEGSDSVRSYILAGTGVRPGALIKVGDKTSIKSGNRLKLRNMPLGSFIYNIELSPGKGGQLVRSAGVKAQLAAREGNWAQVRMPSGEIRLIHIDCYATLGTVGNAAHQNVKWGSAGRRRKLGQRPKVRGKAMNPADHPMGGGEGQSSPGRLPRTPWGKIAIGPKTRRRKQTDKYILRSRKLGRR